jgi:hypothetical protein
MVETPKRLEESVLEVRAYGSEESDKRWNIIKKTGR